MENDITNIILFDGSDDDITVISSEITRLKTELNDLSLDNYYIYDINGNKLSDSDMTNFKKVAMALFCRAYFSKIDNNVYIEVIKR